MAKRTRGPNSCLHGIALGFKEKLLLVGACTGIIQSRAIYSGSTLKADGDYDLMLVTAIALSDWLKMVSG